MKSVRLLITIVIVLVLVNCALLAVFWFQRGKGPGQNGPPQRAHEFLKKELGLTKEQDEAYEKMRISHFATTRALNDANRKLHDSLFNYINTPDLDTPTATRLEGQIAFNQTQLEKATLLHFRELRSILNAQQQKKFDGVIKDALRMMGGPPRGRMGPNGMPPPRDGQGPPPGQGPPNGEGPPPGEGFPPPPGQ
ncbi:Spy/CpxP family protein refolding chaperone [Mucilaginibacter calamicampi]|uniref:Spy/CpxP family protein refolding chaperone n=1 Tax=Mucilaginibacter calamicampi TaxID=1302352 RepID=A0ABW2YZB1_9SPHI